MRFTKMHGCGNDYIVIGGFEQQGPAEPGRFARRACDRHRGIGADGLILLDPRDPATAAVARMRIFNPDGTEAEMCGNGIRCAAKWLRDHGAVDSDAFGVQTACGVVSVHVSREQAGETQVCVDMEAPVFDAKSIPTTLQGTPPVDVAVDVEGQSVRVTCLSTGNPHCVVFVDSLDDQRVRRLGPALERHEAFPNRTNVEFVQALSRSELAVRVWERGVGETLACGTGACAAAVASVLTHRAGERVRIRMRGGTLHVDWSDRRAVFLTGPAVEVFEGIWLGSM
ncbi:MAG TPA: diaminopimelate epimerase [Planctomycetaceae bacterium]|nr:diaminopimelate epimerase [Planctomycetaceae bacterium]